jgi:outer membrane autotransporter protein
MKGASIKTRLVNDILVRAVRATWRDVSGYDVSAGRLAVASVLVIGVFSCADAAASGTIVVVGGTQQVSDDESVTGDIAGFQVGDGSDATSTLVVQAGGVVGNGDTSTSTPGISTISGRFATVEVDGGGTLLGETSMNGGLIKLGVGQATQAIVDNSNSANEVALDLQLGAMAQLDNVSITSAGSTAAINTVGSSLTATSRTVINSVSDGIDVTAGQNQVNVILNGTTINAGRDGIQVSGSGAQANLTGANITAKRFGVISASGAGVTIDGGTIVGTGENPLPPTTGFPDVGAAGVYSDRGNTTIEGATIEGFGARSVGIVTTSASSQPNIVTVKGSQIEGGRNGVYVSQSDGVSNTTLSVDNSTVKGDAGAAILADGSAGMLIADVENGSSLIGGNGAILQTINDGSALLTVGNSALTGDLDNTAGKLMDVTLNSGGSVTGAARSVSQMTVNAGGIFTMTGSSSISGLTIAQGGDVYLSPSRNPGNPAPFNGNTLTVANLNGNGGTFHMNVDFQTGNGDKLNVTGAASGAHLLSIPGSTRSPTSDADITVVTAKANSAATFSIASADQKVDVGTWKYSLVKQTGQSGDQWVLDTSNPGEPGNPGNGNPPLSNAAASVLGLTSVASTIWYGENMTLDQRMGQLQQQPKQQGGIWVVPYVRRYDIDASAGTPYRQNQTGFMAGIDKHISSDRGDWYFGGLFGYSNSALSFDSGSSGTVNSVSLGGYATWFGDSGWYADMVMKLNNFSNETSVLIDGGGTATGTYHSVGVGGSVELGKQMSLNKSLYVQPFGQISAFRASSADFVVGDGMQVHEDAANSIQVQLGIKLGTTLPLRGKDSYINPYVKLSAISELVSSNNTNINGTSFDNSLSGTRGVVGAGLAAHLGDRLHAHVDIDIAKGARISQPFGVDAGLRYVW